MTDRATDLIVDALDRVQHQVHGIVPGLDRAGLAARLDPGANSIAWLVWHLTRIEDDHIAGVAGSTQVWHDGWRERLALPFDPDDHGFGHSSAQVAAVDVDPNLLLGYHDAVHDRAVDYLRSVPDEDLSRIVDSAWDPPVTLAARLVSIVGDCTAHIGQAAFVRGVLDRRAG